MNAVQEFYNQIQFPGHYTAAGLAYHQDQIKNPYLKIIDQQITKNTSVLDVGCGTGLISNLMAIRHPTSSFTGIDFADSIDYATSFATANKIKNVQFERHDFVNYPVAAKFDVVICQGVLHHITKQQEAITKLKQLVKPNGVLVLGLYHPWGKIVKRFCNIDYKNKTLWQDQEHNPFEDSYTFKQVLQEFPEFSFETAYPYVLDTFIAVPSFFNYRNGGLVTYIFKNHNEIVL